MNIAQNENAKDQENSVDIVEQYKAQGVSNEEIALAQKHGIIKDDKESYDVTNGVVNNKNIDETDSQNEKKSEDPSSFDEIDKVYESDETAFHKNYSPNAKALYFKQKEEKRKRQVLQKEFDDYKLSAEQEKVKEAAARSKLDRIREKLSREPENLTIEELQAIVGVNEQVDDKNRPLTMADIDRINADKLSKEKTQQIALDRQKLTESILKTKHENVDDLVNLAKDVVSSNPIYQKALVEAFNDNNIDESTLANMVYDFAKLNPKFNEIGSKPKKNEEVERAIKNANRVKSSASVTAGTGRRVRNPEDLTVEEAAALPPKEWAALPRSVQERVLREATI